VLHNADVTAPIRSQRTISRRIEEIPTRLMVRGGPDSTGDSFQRVGSAEAPAEWMEKAMNLVRYDAV